MNRRQLIAALAATPFIPHAGRAAEALPPTAAALAQDIVILRRALTLHCGLYRYSSAAVVSTLR